MQGEGTVTASWAFYLVTYSSSAGSAQYFSIIHTVVVAVSKNFGTAYVESLNNYP